jgi:uncharacterized protein YciI
MAGRIYKSILVFTLAFSALLMAQTPPDNPLAPYIPKNMKPYYLDILVTKDSPEASIPDAERMAWMQKHLAYIRSQAEAGKFVLVGPVTEEGRIRGIAVIKTDSLEEARRIAANDPLVQAGLLSVEVHPIQLVDLSSIHFDYPPLK